MSEASIFQYFCRRSLWPMLVPLTTDHGGQKEGRMRLSENRNIWHSNSDYLGLCLISLDHHNSSHNDACKNQLIFHLVSYFFPAVPLSPPPHPLNWKMKGMSKLWVDWEWYHISVTNSESHWGIWKWHLTKIHLFKWNSHHWHGFSNNFGELWTAMLYNPQKTKDLPFVIIIYKRERKFVWFLNSEQEEQHIKSCSDWETRTWNLSSVNKVIWRTIYLFKMLLWYKFATGTSFL